MPRSTVEATAEPSGRPATAEAPRSAVPDESAGERTLALRPASRRHRDPETHAEPAVEEQETARQAPVVEDADTPGTTDAPIGEDDAGVEPGERDDVRFDGAQYDEAQYDEARYDEARYDEARYDEARYDEARYDEAARASLDAQDGDDEDPRAGHHLAVVPDADDPAQHFVARLRAAAADFAAAAGARSAVVREAVPPARHRRSRCRVVLRYADGEETDLTFLGSVGRPGTPAWADFELQIQRWLDTGQHREAAWLVEDHEAPDGVAVDVPAWLAAG